MALRLFKRRDIGRAKSSTTATTAELADVADKVNTRASKKEGTVYFNTDTNKPVYAVGSAAADVWVDATGATVHTPV